MNKYFFITGTDTNVGKTIISCAFLQAASEKGYRTAGYKPVASSSQKTFHGLRNLDAQLLRKNSSLKLDYNDVNPIVFFENISPNIASEISGNPINFDIMNNGLYKLQQLADFIIIEGVGGWCTPVSMKNTLADWVIKHQLPVILIVAIKLGCINHAILTTKVIIQSGVSLIGWVANNIIQDDIYQEYIIKTLKTQLNIPCLGIIPYFINHQFYSVSKYLNFKNILF